MAVTVKKAVLWRKEIDNRPGMLASTLEPLAEAGADLQVVMGYRYPGGTDKAAIELHPVSGRESTVRQRQLVSLRHQSQYCWCRETIAGLGHALAKAIGDAGINLIFVMAQVMGRRYSAMFGLENEADAARATGLIKKASAPVRKK